jgi:hypothetical protein
MDLEDFENDIFWQFFDKKIYKIIQRFFKDFFKNISKNIPPTNHLKGH